MTKNHMTNYVMHLRFIVTSPSYKKIQMPFVFIINVYLLKRARADAALCCLNTVLVWNNSLEANLDVCKTMPLLKLRK
jgi:hypothetical protein